MPECGTNVALYTGVPYNAGFKRVCAAVHDGTYGGAVAWRNSALDSAMVGPEPVLADAASVVIDFTHRIHQALVGVYGEKAEEILIKFRDELHAQIETNSQVESACRDGLQLAISTHVPVAAGHARLLQGLVEARNFYNASAGADAHETQAAATFKRSDERLQAIARINVAWGKDILEHYKFDEIGRTTAVCLAQVAQLYPDWSRAVQRINAAMLSRHISSLTDNGQRIGDHHSTSNVKDRNRPIEAADAKLVVEWRRQGIVELAGVRVADAGNDLPQELQRTIDEWTTCETVPSAFQSTKRSFNLSDGLHKDRHGLLVPRSSAINQKRKRSNRSGAGKSKRTGAPSSETRRDSCNNSTGCSAGDACLTADPGSLPTEGYNVHLVSTPVETAMTRARNATEAVGVNVENLEDILAAENSVQDRRSSGAQDNTCEQFGEAYATSIGSVPRRLGTSSKTVNLRRGQENTDLFVSSLDQSSPLPSQSQRSGLEALSGDTASRGASLDLTTATVQGKSVTEGHTVDGTVGAPGSFTASKSPGVVNTAESHGPALRYQLSSDPVFETATRANSSDSVESNGENEHEASLQDLPHHSSFFEEEYNVTMAGRSPQLFSHNCPTCIGPCAVGRAPENWTGVELDLLHKRLLEARHVLEEMARVTDSQSAAWVDGFHGANIFFQPHMPQSCEKSDADAYSFALDALKCLAADKTVLDRPTIVRRSDDRSNVDVGRSTSCFRRLIETHICLAGNRWLRSLRGTHLCMVPSQASMCTTTQAAFHPQGNSRAIFLEATDILFIPQGTPSAVFTFEDSHLQSGTIRDCSHNVQLRADELVEGLGEIMAMPGSLVRT